MERWSIIANREINGLVFGETRESIREKLGTGYQEFKKNRFSVNTCDDYGYCHIYYDEYNCFKAIEIFNFVEVYFNDMCVFPTKESMLLDSIIKFENEDGCLISKDLSIGITLEDGITTGILVGSEGYYK